MENKIQIGDRIEAIWCVDSETGQKLLIDLISGQVVMTEDQYNAIQRH